MDYAYNKYSQKINFKKDQRIRSEKIIERFSGNPKQLG